MIIGICGLIGSGKGTVSDYLVDEYGFEKISFADKLKDGVSAVFGWDRDMLEGDNSDSRQWREQEDEFWSKETGKDPRGYFTKDEIQKSKTTLKELFDEYLEFYKQTHSEVTYVDRKRKFDQSLIFFGENTSITDLEWDRGGRSRVLELIKTIKSDNTPVSNGDLEINEYITKKILQITPNIPIISEETSDNKLKLIIKNFWVFDL